MCPAIQPEQEPGPEALPWWHVVDLLSLAPRKLLLTLPGCCRRAAEIDNYREQKKGFGEPGSGVGRNPCHQNAGVFFNLFT